MGTLISILKRFINSDLTKPLNTMIDEVKSTLNLIKDKTDTITAGASLTQTQANNLDAAISSRQANAGLTTTHASRIDAAISSRASQASVDSLNAKSGLPILKAPVRFSVTIAGSSGALVYSVTGRSGRLHYITLPGVVSITTLRIDGVAIASAGSLSMLHSGNIHSLPLEFSTSLEIHVHNASTSSAAVSGTVYLN